MGKLKTSEIVILAVSALVTIAKSIVKFIDYLCKLMQNPATSTVELLRA